jgi:ribonuclease HI
MKTTNNRMELTAVVKVLQNLKKLYSKKAKVEIYSDSAYVVNAVNQDWIKRWKANGWKLTSTKDDVKNRDLWEQLDHVMSLYEIKPELIKVKGHSGNRYNEMADKVAVWEVSIMKGEA